MTQPSTAGRLLADVYRESPALRDSVASAAGVPPERADDAANGMVRLSLSEQLRLSEAVILMVPQLSRQALRLRGQVLAARSYEAGDTQTHSEAPVGRWESSAQLRR